MINEIKMEYIWDYLNDKTYNTKVGLYKFKREYKFITTNSTGRLNNVLDIAGGSGRFALPLYSSSNKMTVLDVNSTALDILKGRNRNVNTICSDFIKSEISDTFSLILCVEAIEYFEDWEAFFSKTHEILKEDGRFIFTYANPGSWRYFLRKMKHWKNKPTRYNEMTFCELKEVLHKCNFEIENMEGMNWIPFPLSSNSKLVSFFEFIENFFRLRYWYSQSPWILLSIRKCQTHSSES